MPTLIWDKTGEKIFETGASKGVLYPQDDQGAYPKGVVWNGLISVTESPSGAEATPLWADNTKYLNLVSVEEFGATVEAYTYPDEFAVCDGSAELAPGVYVGQQDRRNFGLSYQTVVGNDVLGTAFGYKLHLIYNALAAPSEKPYTTINDSPDGITFSWELSTTPIPFPGMAKPSACLTIDSTKLDEDGKTALAALEAILYGSDSAEAYLPLPEEIATIFAAG